MTIFNTNGLAINDTDISSSSGAGLVGWSQRETGAVSRLVQDKLRESKSIDDYGADPTGVNDSTAAINAALLANRSVLIPQGIYKFTSIKVPNRGTVFCGTGLGSVLVQTGTGTAITCLDSSSTIYPGGAPAYVNDGQFTFRDFLLYTNGAVGIDFSKNRTTGSSVERVYMKPYAYYSAYTNSTYVAGTTAISCDNTVWMPSTSTYNITVRQCWIAGYENIAKLDQTVNFWGFDRVYGVDNLRFLNLSPTNGAYNGVGGISVTNSYFESGVAGARGIVFGIGGGNNVRLDNVSFELTNAAGTQYAYDFTAGGTWAQINVSSCKYLLQGDGNGVNDRRLTGTAPLGFVETGRTYTNTTLANNLPMTWAPGVSLTAPYQLPPFLRAGGISQGNGTLILGRSGADSSDGKIANDGAYGLTFTAPGSGGTVDFLWQDAAATGILRFRSYTTPGFYPVADNTYPCGQVANRWSVVYAGTGAINTSDGREKQQVQSISDKEKIVANKLKKSLVKYKFNDAVREKGDAARIHFGIIAQDVKQAFEDEGLVAEDYAMLCYDEWEASDDQPAGNKYGVRYDELLAFILAAS